MNPFPHQLKPIAVLAEAIRCNRSALDASDTGVGKTFHALFACKEANRRAAIVCPLSVIPKWREAAQAVGVDTLFIQNIEALKVGQYWIQGDGRKWQWRAHTGVTIIDEVHRFSGYDSENGFILANAPKPVLMLSATAAGDPTKMRGIGHQLRLFRWDEAYYWCARYGCKKGFRGRGLAFKGTQEHLDRIHRQIFTTGLGVRVRQSEITGFPEHFIETVAVPVDDQEAIDKAYQAELKALETDAPNPAVQILRARQISEHNKLAATIDLINDLVESGSRIAVFVNFRDSLERLVGAFKCPSVYGEQPPNERQEGIAAFQADKEPVLACMIQAGGESINLQGKNRIQIVFPGWSARELHQAMGRCPRVGGERVITKLVFADQTLETRIRETINEKLRNQATINDGDLTMKGKQA